MRPVEQTGLLTGTNFALGSYDILAQDSSWEKAKDPGDEFWHKIQETKQTWQNTKL